MSAPSDNPYDDGLDFIGCPPRLARIRLPDFPEHYKYDSKLVCWGRGNDFPDGQRTMIVSIENFRPVKGLCGVYSGSVTFFDGDKGDKWYTGKLRFHYTRNYIYKLSTGYHEIRPIVVFRFVVKGDLERVSDEMPEWTAFVLCTKEAKGAKSYDKFFVYGGFDVLYDVREKEAKGFILSLGHNDGWYTHHLKCSRRPIDHKTHIGDYIGHYCDRGWLFVSPGRNFVFNPHLKPPTGRFHEEALRRIGERCLTEEAIEYGYLRMTAVLENDFYQKLEGWTACKSHFESAKSCMGYVGTGEPHDFLTFLSMGYWDYPKMDARVDLHLVEGSVRFENHYEKEMSRYFYGFSTYMFDEDLKLVDLVDNRDIIGVPEDTELLLYLFNAGVRARNPKERYIELDPRVSHRLVRSKREYTKKREECPFMLNEEPQK